MKELKRTTDDGLEEIHHHIVYLDEDTGEAVMSAHDGHSHPIQWVEAVPEQPEQPPQFDEYGQQISEGIPAQEAQPGYWEIGVDEYQTHKHRAVVDYQPVIKQKREREDLVIKDVVELFKMVVQNDKGCYDESKEDHGFYCGDGQWTAEQRGFLEGQDRACLTFNYTEKFIDDLSGFQREQRTDFQLLPVEGGDVRACDMYGHVIKNITEQCNYHYEESEAFLDAAIGGKGDLHLFMDYADDIEGTAKIERFPWDDVWYGPHEKRDQSDCEVMFKDRLHSMAKLKQLYPKKANKIQKDFDLFVLMDGKEKKQHTTYETDQYAKSDNRYTVPYTVGGLPMVDLYNKEYRVLECWRKIYVPATVVADPANDFYFNAYGWDAKDLKAVESIEGLFLIERNIPKMRITRIAGNVLLSDENPADLPVDDFFTFPIWAKRRNGKFWGKVRVAKDSQRELNRRRSQAIDIGNKMVAYNYFYDDRTFADEDEADRFLEEGNNPGAVFKVGDTNRIPVKSEGVKFPSELVGLIDLSKQDFAELMSVIVEPTGANQSASHLMQTQQMKLKGNEYLFDSLSFTKKRIGRALIALIRKYYSPDRIYRILTNQNAKKQIKIGQQAFEEFTKEEIVEILENADVAKMDVIVSETAFTPSMRMATLAVLKEMQQSGSPVPPESIINLMPIPESEKEAQRQALAAQQDAQMQQQQMTVDMEENKALLGAGIMPPAMQRKLDEQAAQAGQPPSEEQFIEGDGSEQPAMEGSLAQ